MKYLKIFEKKWTENRIDSFIKEKEEISDLLKTYLLKSYPKDCEDLYSVINFNYTVVNGEKWMVVEVLLKPENGGFTNESFLIRDLNDLYIYIENPDIYDDTKKYNL